jgi:hypothetical protein
VKIINFHTIAYNIQMAKSLIKALEDASILGSNNSGWDGNDILRRIINTVFLGLFATLIFAISYFRKGAIGIATTGLMTAGAAFLIGSVIGFLFGIPRTLQDNPDNQADKGKLDRRANDYQPNTNLEQISDWLTKILVGVGLTQINQIRENFSNIVHFVKSDLGNNSTFAATIIIYFLLCGFMLGYLWSRLYMAKALVNADIEAVSKRIVHEVQLKTDIQAEADAKALGMINTQLNPAPGANPISQNDLTKAMIDASPVIKVTAFNQAHVFRQQNWKDNKQKIELVIPIFQSLIASDPEQRFHRNHAQLGYALKDKVNPDWQSAETELTKAIEIRDKKIEIGKWLFYEFNRAYCRIMLNKTSSTLIFSINDIIQDLRLAVKSDGIKKITLSDPIITQWMKESNITEKDIIG